MHSPVRVCICTNGRSSHGRNKRVRINPVVERTTLMTPTYSRHRSGNDLMLSLPREDSYWSKRQSSYHRRSPSPLYDRYPGVDMSSWSRRAVDYNRDRHRGPERSHSRDRDRDRDRSYREYPNHKHRSHRHRTSLSPSPPSPLPVHTRHARMRSPQRERPLYDDDEEDFTPRHMRPRRAVTETAPSSRRQHHHHEAPPRLANDDRSKVPFTRRHHYFARGDSLTHKNLTRTYVFHRYKTFLFFEYFILYNLKRQKLLI